MPIITQSDDKLKEHTLKNVTVSVRPQRLQGSFALILCPFRPELELLALWTHSSKRHFLVFLF